MVIEEIIHRNPHVIGLQEVCRNNEVDMSAYILKELKRNKYQVRSYARAETHRSFLKYQEELLIISRMEAKQKTEGSLPSLKFFENKFLGLKIGDTWFVTTHLHFALPSIRSAQYEVLNQAFQNSRTIVFGDMNSHPGNREARIFLTAGWKSFFNGPTYPSSDPDKIFDGFWVTGPLADSVKSAKVDILFSEYNDPPSDHLGIYLFLDTI